MRSTKEKAELCRALHAGPEPTLSAACWDVGTACLLAHVGVPLIDTTSFGAMATRGLPDAVGLATRDFMLGNARLIAAAVDLPVQADLENGFGDSPEIVAQTILGSWHHGRSWWVHRGRDGAPGRPNLSARVGERAHPRCGRGGPCATVSVHADRSRRPISLGSPRPCRIDPTRSWCRASATSLL